jgi:hypothetical protein
MRLKRVYVDDVIKRGPIKLYRIVQKYDRNVKPIQSEIFYGRFMRHMYKKSTTELTFRDEKSERIVIGHNEFYSVELHESIKESITNRPNHIPSLQDLAKMKLSSDDIEKLRKHYPGIFM